MAPEKRNMVAADEHPPAAGDDAQATIAALRAENARLREELATAANRGTAAERDAEGIRAAAAKTPREVAGHKIPDGVFVSEGMREELERTGRTTDPATGVRLGDWPKDDDTVRAAR